MAAINGHANGLAVSHDTNGHATSSHVQKLRIVVIGGSLGGLAAGIALVRLGHDVTILERNRSELLHNQGAGIVAGGDTLAFFKKYDRCKRPLACTSQRRIYLDRKGDIVHQVEMEQNMTSWDLAYYLLRANFDGVESAYCDVPAREPTDGAAAHLHGHTLIGLDDAPAGVNVRFRRADGTEGSLHADLVVGADGPSSTVRELLCPGVERTYAGYCALRGTIPENEASPAARAAFCNRFAFFHGPGVQTLAYLIPGTAGSTTPGTRLINFVWYANFPPGDSFTTLMTDTSGATHRITLPPGQMRREAWERQRALADEMLPPQFAELVHKTAKPFAQAVTDVISPGCEFMDGKVVLLGDALAGFRPHTVASTSQAAFDAMLLADMVEAGGVGGVGEAARAARERWRRETMALASNLQRRGVEMGERSQHQVLELDDYVRDRDRASVPRHKEVYPDWVY